VVSSVRWAGAELEKDLCNLMVEARELYQKLRGGIISLDGLLGPSSFYLVLKLSLACKIRDSAFRDIGVERLRISKIVLKKNSAHGILCLEWWVSFVGLRRVNSRSIKHFLQLNPPIVNSPSLPIHQIAQLVIAILVFDM